MLIRELEMKVWWIEDGAPGMIWRRESDWNGKINKPLFLFEKWRAISRPIPSNSIKIRRGTQNQCWRGRGTHLGDLPTPEALYVSHRF
jgi:hypothetical protein